MAIFIFRYWVQFKLCVEETNILLSGWRAEGANQAFRLGDDALGAVEGHYPNDPQDLPLNSAVLYNIKLHGNGSYD